MDTKAEIKLIFTSAEREQVREALLRYMSERGIGAPTLYWEICKHDPAKREMSMRTLQRFLARAHQTDDHNVSICYEFAKTLPYFGKISSFTELGLSLASFYGTVTGASLSWSLTEKSVFQVRFAERHIWMAELIEAGQEVPFHKLLPCSIVSLEPTGDPRFAVSTEVAINRYARAPLSQFPDYHAKGIALAIEPRVLMHFMRESLTRRPQIVLWTADKVGDEDTLLLVSYSDSEHDDDLTLPISTRTLRAKPERRIPADEFNF